MVKILQYEELTPEQKEYFLKNIWNGVGSREFPIDPHDLIFGPASVLHDFEYWRGGNESYRIAADKTFLKNCLSLVKKQPKYKQPFYYVAAYVYYCFLTTLGKYAFEYSTEPAKTWEELLERFLKYQEENQTKKKQVARYLIKQVHRYGSKSIPKSV